MMPAIGAESTEHPARGVHWRSMRGFHLSLMIVALPAAGAFSGPSHPEAQVSLDVIEAPRPGFVPEAAPSRFVLLDEGRVFVGGTRDLASGQLDKAELKELDALIARVRKLPGLGSSVTLGPGETEYRLWLRRGRELEIVAKGDPAAAPAALRPLAQLVERLAGFNHTSLASLAPSQYLLGAREESLDGGCRPWTLPAPLADVLASRRLVTADAADHWPTGALAASVCADAKRYAVTLRPLIPGERP
jgi:hypothetical protein